jgi:hypothetical protein
VKRAIKIELQAFKDTQWDTLKTGLAVRYRQWGLEYNIACLRELEVLGRATLHKLLALRTGHGDFTSYHIKYNHDPLECEMHCRHCGMDKSPEHLVFCRKSLAEFRLWPWPEEEEDERPTSVREFTTRDKRHYLRYLVDNPGAFAEFIQVTGYFGPAD